MPIIVTEGGATWFVLAARGGQGQLQVHVQLLLRLWDGVDVAAAVDAQSSAVVLDR